MELDIKKPSYYKQYYEVNDEVIEMCNEIMKNFTDKSYSTIVKIVDILPVVAPPEKLEQGFWAEEVMFSKSIGRISIFKHIDYNKYINGTVEERKKLTIKCIIESIWMIKKKPRTKFNAKQFEKDLLDFVGYSKEELNVDKFSISMNSKVFDNRPVTEQLIKEAIDYVISQTKKGIYDFLTLINQDNESFIQFVLEPEGYQVEIRYPDTEDGKKTYVTEILHYGEMINSFYDFYKGKKIDISDYEDISHYLK